MLSKIKYDLTFSNGKTIKNELELNSGSTLITGANGKGKSLNFEMVGFALFGNKALRGIAGDYKRMKVEVIIAINGETYTINRTKSKSEVFHKDEPIVSGTKPVNQWIVRTLGYGFDVFRIAHWCAQGGAAGQHAAAAVARRRAPRPWARWPRRLPRAYRERHLRAH